jgi:hypothetical protein
MRRLIAWWLLGSWIVLGFSGCTQQECGSNADCKRGQFCRQQDYRCVSDCRADVDCPLGAYCELSCGVCLHCDPSPGCVVNPILGQSTIPNLGSCTIGAPPVDRCRVRPAESLACAAPAPRDAGGTVAADATTADAADAGVADSDGPSPEDVAASDVTEVTDSAAGEG